MVSWRGKLVSSVLELFYGPLAPLYPLLTRVVAGRRWQRWQRVVTRWLPDARLICELGCGLGELAAYLAGAGYGVIAVDRSRSMVRLARQRTRQAGVLVLCADARNIPLRDRSVDAVVMTFPTSVFFEPALQSEIARVLRPGGLAVVVVAVSPRQWPWWIRPFMVLLRPRYGLHLDVLRRECSLPEVPLKSRWESYDAEGDRLLLWIGQRLEEGFSGREHVTAPRDHST